MPTLKEVAKAAEVSTVTASSVLSGANRVRVSDETAKRIQQVAREMNYVPRAAARGLRTGRVDAIAFIASGDPTSRWQPYWQEILRGISDLLWDRTERLILSLPGNEEQELDALRQLAFGRQVDGLIIQNVRNDDPRVRLLQDAKVPFVALEGERLDGLHSVAFDMAQFSRLLARNILQHNGALAVIASKAGVPGETELLEGLRATTAESNQPYHEWRKALLPDAAWFKDACQSAAGAPLGILLLRRLLPEVLGRLEAAGLGLGHDVDITYLTGAEEVILQPEGLRTLQLDYYTLGRRATQRLFQRIEKKELPPARTLVLPGIAEQLNTAAAE